MNIFEIYSLLFTDTLVSNLVFSTNDEVILNSMKGFGIYNNLRMIIIATSSAILAISLNYLLGRILYNIFAFSKDSANHLRYRNFAQLLSKYIIAFLLLCGIPFWGKFVAVLAGFCRLNLLKVLLICSFAKLCYYVYLLLF
jgi:membrane protein YqaA with SNARE-associated domain